MRNTLKKNLKEKKVLRRLPIRKGKLTALERGALCVASGHRKHRCQRCNKWHY